MTQRLRGLATPAGALACFPVTQISVTPDLGICHPFWLPWTSHTRCIYTHRPKSSYKMIFKKGKKKSQLGGIGVKTLAAKPDA